MLKMIGPMF